jgi:hypothetical protein
LARQKTVYTPDGDRVSIHEHTWVQVSVTLLPNTSHISISKPILGARVLWRCTRRNCKGFRETTYAFKKPRVDSNSNVFSPGLQSVLNDL